MKKLTALSLCVCLLAGILSGCAYPPEAPPDGTIRIVTTIVPIYDWTRNILGSREDVELTLLLDNRVDLHSFQPTAEDLVKIAECDLFICVGGESDDWVDDALRDAGKKGRNVIRLMDEISYALKEEESVEGMQEDPDEEESDPEYDEHIWLSLRNAANSCLAIAVALGHIDPEYKQSYRENAIVYCGRLNSLDSAYQTAVNLGTKDTLLFGDRFPFRYMVEDYGLNYFAAFSGCSAETEASFETILFLANKLDELDLGTILTLEGSDGEIAKTIRETAAAHEASILAIDSMQGTTLAEAEAGTAYLAVMEQNLDVLRFALR